MPRAPQGVPEGSHHGGIVGAMPRFGEEELPAPLGAVGSQPPTQAPVAGHPATDRHRPHPCLFSRQQQFGRQAVDHRRLEGGAGVPYALFVEPQRIASEWTPGVIEQGGLEAGE